MDLKRPRNTQRVRCLVVPLFSLIFLLFLAGCGPDPLNGRVVLSGSSTLAPLATLAVDQWKKIHPQVEARVEAIGSDAGLDRLILYGDADFALVSRPLTSADQDKAKAAGKELFTVPLAWDAVCLVVPASNTWAKSLTRVQVAQAFTTARMWSDLDPLWPDRPIHRFALGPNSGTADVFADAILGGNKTALFQGSQVQASEDDQILARGVSAVSGALGYVGWTTFRDADPTLRVVALDGVVPSPTAIRTRAYGLPRRLWLVGTRQGMTTNRAARSLLGFLYGQYRSLATESGLVALSDEERAQVDMVIKEFSTH